MRDNKKKRQRKNLVNINTNRCKPGKITADPKHRLSILTKLPGLLPPGYYFGSSAEGGGNYSILLNGPYYDEIFEPVSRFNGTNAYKIVLAAIKVARRDALITSLAEAMCLSINRQPWEVIAYPFGPTNINTMSHLGNGMMVPGVVEIRPALHWLRPMAGMMLAFEESKKTANILSKTAKIK